MSEDKNDNINDTADDTATLKEKLEQSENERAALEMKLKKSDDDLYSDEYLAFLQERKKKEPQNNFMSGGRLTDYSDDEIQGMPISKLVGLIRNDVYAQIKEEEDTKMTKQQRDNEKKRVGRAREEIKTFAGTHPDFKNYVAKISELADENPNLNIEQLYKLAGGDIIKKQETKPTPPNTRTTIEGGIRKSDKDLSLREVIAREYQKLK